MGIKLAEWVFWEQIGNKYLFRTSAAQSHLDLRFYSASSMQSSSVCTDVYAIWALRMYALLDTTYIGQEGTETAVKDNVPGQQSFPGPL